MHPKEAKEKLAYIITKEHHGKKEADAAREGFIKKHTTRTARGSKEVFLEVAETKPLIWKGKEMSLVDLMVLSKCAKSKTEARRLIEQGAVRINNSVIKKLNIYFSKKEILLQVGKLKYVRIIPK